MIDDLEALRAEMTATDRRYLQTVVELADPRHPAWLGIPGATDAVVALERLAAF